MSSKFKLMKMLGWWPNYVLDGKERERELEKDANIVKVFTITTSENNGVSHVSKTPTIHGNIVGVGNVFFTSSKNLKLLKPLKLVLIKVLEI